MEVTYLSKSSMIPKAAVTHPEFSIATKIGGFLPWHVDNFGKATVAIILEGVKIWYLPTGDQDIIRQDHSAGEVLPGSERLKVKLKVGNVL